MSQTIDARGMACPLPVINTKKVLDGLTEGTVITIVDNEAARDNVKTFATGLGCEVKIVTQDNDHHIHITKKPTASIEQQEVKNLTGATVFLFTSSEMGRGSDELGKILMKSFMFTLFESGQHPASLMFINSAVYLTTEGSPVLEYLKELNQQGVEILSCGTCLDYFNLKDKLQVGQVTNMYTILEKLNGAAKALTI